jgi:hypothetical protein
MGGDEFAVLVDRDHEAIIVVIDGFPQVTRLVQFVARFPSWEQTHEQRPSNHILGPAW